MLPKPRAFIGIEQGNLPAFERAVAERVSNCRTGAKCLPACLSVAFEIVQQEAVAIERRERALFPINFELRGQFETLWSRTGFRLVQAFLR